MRVIHLKPSLKIPVPGYWCVCESTYVHACITVHVWRSVDITEVSSLLPPCGFQRWNSVYQVGSKALLLTEPSRQPSTGILYCSMLSVLTWEIDHGARRQFSSLFTPTIRQVFNLKSSVQKLIKMLS